jgi:hypothetical protein
MSEQGTKQFCASNSDSSSESKNSDLEHLRVKSDVYFRYVQPGELGSDDEREEEEYDDKEEKQVQSCEDLRLCLLDKAEDEDVGEVYEEDDSGIRMTRCLNFSDSEMFLQAGDAQTQGQDNYSLLEQSTESVSDSEQVSETSHDCEQYQGQKSQRSIKLENVHFDFEDDKKQMKARKDGSEQKLLFDQISTRIDSGEHDRPKWSLAASAPLERYSRKRKSRAGKRRVRARIQGSKYAHSHRLPATESSEEEIEEELFPLAKNRLVPYSTSSDEEDDEEIEEVLCQLQVRERCYCSNYQDFWLSTALHVFITLLPINQLSVPCMCCVFSVVMVSLVELAGKGGCLFYWCFTFCLVVLAGSVVLLWFGTGCMQAYSVGFSPQHFFMQQGIFLWDGCTAFLFLKSSFISQSIH